MNGSGNRTPRDELGLPAVPPRAPATNPWRDRALAAVFAAGIALPGLSMFVAGSRTTMQFENRPAAPWPVVTGYRLPPDFPGAFERAFADRFGGRDALIGFHHAATVVLFRRSPVQNVLVGRDGWLYYKGDDGRAFDRDFRRATPPSAAETAAIADGIARRVRFLAGNRRRLPAGGGARQAHDLSGTRSAGTAAIVRPVAARRAPRDASAGGPGARARPAAGADGGAQAAAGLLAHRLALEPARRLGWRTGNRRGLAQRPVGQRAPRAPRDARGRRHGRRSREDDRRQAGIRGTRSHARAGSRHAALRARCGGRADRPTAPRTRRSSANRRRSAPSRCFTTPWASNSCSSWPITFGRAAG